MATYKEICSMVLDLLKETSDDSFYNEEHVIFLANHFRPYLIERKYKKSRNTPFSSVSDENKQQICIDLTPTEMLPGDCGGNWLRSVEKLPETVDVMDASISAPSDMLFTNITWIAPERMPYVGYNKWLNKIVYAALSADGYLYMTGQNPAFQHLEQIKMEAVFTDAEAAAKMSCDTDDNSSCEVLDMEFPLEKSLIIPCIEMIVQELSGARYAPQDKQNNASDELSETGLASRRFYGPSSEADRRAATETSAE